MSGTNFGIYRPSSSSGISATANSGTSMNTQANNNQTSGATSSTGAATTAIPEDKSGQQLVFGDLMTQIEENGSIVPDAAIAHYLNEAGLNPTDQRIVRLIGLATQKFISDVADNALQHSKQRTNKTNTARKDEKNILTSEDLNAALSDFGMVTRKAQYFT